MLPKFFKGFVYALAGIKIATKTQLNLKVHLIAVVLVMVVSAVLGVSHSDFLIFMLLFAMVISAELLNTCIEEIANFIRDLHKLDYKATKNIRDMAAGAVLVNAIVATVIAVLILANYLKY